METAQRDPMGLAGLVEIVRAIDDLSPSEAQAKAQHCAEQAADSRNRGTEQLIWRDLARLLRRVARS